MNSVDALTSSSPPSNYLAHKRAEAPVSKVKVTATTASTNEFGHPIRPPEQVEDVRHVTISPPLPSLAKFVPFYPSIACRRMDHEHENPFRPEEELYHEVDPIVEAYLHRPFPPSQPGSANGTPVKTAQSPVQNGVGGGATTSRDNEQKTRQSPVKAKRTSSHGTGGKDTKEDSLDEELPKAGTVELIHIKKKKCGCCSLQ